MVKQFVVALTRNLSLVFVLQNVVPVSVWAHVLQHGCCDRLFPSYVRLV